jgi:hypothetical protein
MGRQDEKRAPILHQGSGIRDRDCGGVIACGLRVLSSRRKILDGPDFCGVCGAGDGGIRASVERKMMIYAISQVFDLNQMRRVLLGHNAPHFPHTPCALRRTVSRRRHVVCGVALSGFQSD